VADEQPDAATNLGRPRDDARREQIIEAALEVFSQRGYQATMKELAAAAGLGSAAHLQHYFPHKDDLFAAALTRHLSLDVLIGHDEFDEPPHRFLPVYIRRYFEQFADHRRLMAFKVFNAEFDRLLSMGLDLSKARLLDVGLELERYLRRQVELGRMVDVGVYELRTVLSGAINLAVQDRANPLVPTPSEDVMIAAVARIVLDGVATDDAA